VRLYGITSPPLAAVIYPIRSPRFVSSTQAIASMRRQHTVVNRTKTWQKQHRHAPICGNRTLLAQAQKTSKNA